jgi:hypothetical protein
METPCMLRSRRYYVGMLAALPAIGVLGTSGRLAATRGMTNVQTFGAKGDGVTDDTKALQNACNSGEVLFVPKTSAFYKTSQFLDLSKSVYSDGAEIRLAQDGTADRSIFRVVQNRAPLTIDGFILNGLYTTGSGPGEYSMGIFLRSVNNVTISNNTIKNSFGDNIYLGYVGTTPCTNVTIVNNTLTNPYRNAVTFIHTDGVVIQNNTITKTFNHVATLDLEPNVDGISNNRNVTIDNNNITTSAQAISVSVNNTVAMTGLRITNNIISATANMFAGVCNAPYFKSNQFTATNFTADINHARMFIFFADCQNITLDSNVDHTTPGTGYHSISLQGASSISVNTNNTFVP